MIGETIVVDYDSYRQFVIDSNFLGCLTACGVDKWLGFQDAVDMYLNVNPSDLTKMSMESKNDTE